MGQFLLRQGRRRAGYVGALARAQALALAHGLRVPEEIGIAG